MAKSGKKTILLHISDIQMLEEVIQYAEKRANDSGLKIRVDYKHDAGLKLMMTGPKDKINIFEHQMREFMAEFA